MGTSVAPLRVLDHVEVANSSSTLSPGSLPWWRCWFSLKGRLSGSAVRLSCGQRGSVNQTLSLKRQSPAEKSFWFILCLAASLY